MSIAVQLVSQIRCNRNDLSGIITDSVLSPPLKPQFHARAESIRNLRE